MSAPLLIGGLLGLVLGVGLVLTVSRLPQCRRADVGRRIHPYLRADDDRALWDAAPPRGRTRHTITLLAGPVARAALGALEALTGGEEQLTRRLRQAGRRSSADQFRIEQVIWGSIGLLIGFSAAIAAITLRGTSPLMGLGIVALGVLTGVLGRDYLLGVEIRHRASRMAREFPTIADLLALAVAAGESPIAAMERVARTSHGALAGELATTVAEV